MFKWIKKIFWFGSKKEFIPFSTFTSIWNSINKSDLVKLYTWYSYVCISAISEWISMLDKKLFQKWKEEELQHKYLDLISSEFLEELVWFLEITWICYIRKHFFWRQIEKLEILKTDSVVLQSDGSYKYLENGKNIYLTSEEVFFVKHFSPFSKTEWISPLEAIGRQQKMDDFILDWNSAFFENWANAGSVLQTEQQVSKEDKEYIAWKWNNEFRGNKKAFKTAILDQGLKLVNMANIGQKDMDFVNQRTMIRDEIFTIFRVPKVVVWITDWVWYTDRMVWKMNFAEFTLKPIAKKIEEAINKNIFAWIWKFSFINIVPTDTEQLVKDFEIGAITLDEYRLKRNFSKIKGGNKNNAWVVFEFENLSDKEISQNETISKNMENILEETFKSFVNKENSNNDSEINSEWQEKILEKRWEKKIKRTDNYEKKFGKIMSNLFEKQEQDILKKLDKKDLEELTEHEKEDLIPTTAYLILFQKYFGDMYYNMLLNEAKIAWEEVDFYKLDNEKIKKFVWENIKKFALEINENTKKEILEIIKNNIKNGEWYENMKSNIKEKFKNYKAERVKKIARTETTRAVNKARVEAWKQAGSVKEKEWWTSPDERGCDFCKTLHWQRIKIWWIFSKNDYEDVSWPPFHPNCRCDLVPILDI